MINQIIPNLPSADLDRTIAFYQKLGFDLLSRYEDYLIFTRQGQELHFFLNDHSHGEDHSHFSCYIRALGVNALYEEFRAAGISLDPPAAKPWGMVEFHIIDPDGSLLRFGERIPL